MSAHSRAGSNPAFLGSQTSILRQQPPTPGGIIKEAEDQDVDTKSESKGGSGNERAKVHLTGSCYCRNLEYTLALESKNEARTSLCHCKDCKKTYGGAFAVIVKVPLQGFRYRGEGKPTVHCSDKGSATKLYREFCNKCGSYICEYGEQIKSHYRYLTLGSLDEPSALPPEGEFFCSQREEWMPEIPGKLAQFSNV